MVESWSFRYYVGPDSQSDVRAEYDSGSKKLRAKFRSRMQSLSELPIEQWRPPLFRSLRGDGAGLGEIRFFVDDVQQRPLGFRSCEHEFTILFWAREKGDSFVPANAIQIALARKKEVVRNRSLADAIWFAME